MIQKHYPRRTARNLQSRKVSIAVAFKILSDSILKAFGFISSCSFPWNSIHFVLEAGPNLFVELYAVTRFRALQLLDRLRILVVKYLG